MPSMNPFPSDDQMTSQQLDRVVNLLREGVGPFRESLHKNDVQNAIGNRRLARELVDTFVRHVDIASGRITVDPHTAVKAEPLELVHTLSVAGWDAHYGARTIESMPRLVERTNRITFIKPQNHRPVEELGHVPVNPYFLAAYNMRNPDFCLSVPNRTHWQHNGAWYIMAFSGSGGERAVYIQPNIRHPSPPFGDPGLGGFWNALVLERS